jgi:DNA-binding winged helix-turn-helix (wHTH) protein/tetratricopeptide (TPR) repeat protein
MSSTMGKQPIDGELPASSDADRAGRAPAPIPLAHRGDLQMGPATIRPSLRVVETAQGSAVAEPRVMQVLLAFIDARGAVLTRDDLIRICWSGAIVGEDAVNRTVAEIRRIARATEAGFGVETIPRVGYRLTGYVEPVFLERVPDLPQPSPAVAAQPLARDSAPRAPVSRRWIVAGAVAGLTGATGLWWREGRSNPQFDVLMDQGRQELRLPTPGADARAATAFQGAVDINAQNASAWGLLSLALRNVAATSTQSEAANLNLAAEQATRRALQLDEHESNALFTRLLMQQRGLDWLATEKEVRRILSIDPANPHVLDFLVSLLQAAGYIQESWNYNEDAIALDALRPTPHYRKALKHWIMGRPDEADQHAGFSMENWPLNGFVRNARLLISAFTGRLHAAGMLLDDPNTSPGMLSAAGIGMWRSGLAALGSRSGPDVSAARDSCLAVAPSSPGLSVHAVLLLSELGEVDAAYQVVEGFLLRRGLIVTRDRQEDGTENESDLGWRSTQWLYTPATKPLRDDPRFALLGDAIGLTDYWSQRGMPPDERRGTA